MQNTPTDQINTIFQSQKDFFLTNQTKNVQYRLDALKKLKKWVQVHEEDIAEALYDDLRKSKVESFLTEIGMVLEDLSLHIGKIHKWSGRKSVLPALNNFPARSGIMPEPYGCVLNISPWNYPFLLTIQPLIGIISAGNTAIIKPSEMASTTAQLIDDMIKELFPPEYIAVFQGDKETAQALLKCPFDYIFYTGNTIVGKIIMKAAAEHLTPLTLELGGKSPVIVHKDANIAIAARRIAWGKTINAGQTCVAPDYIFVHKSVKSKLVEKISEAIDEFYEHDTENGPFARIINDRHFDRLFSYMKDQTILRGGETDAEIRYIAPTIIDEPDTESPLMQEEIFGPLLPIIAYENLDETINFINKRPKPLALYLFTSSKEIRKKVAMETSSGALTINDTIMHLGNHRLPFGGVGGSGMGAYHGKYSFDTFSHHKAIMINSGSIDLPVRYAPYNGFKEKLLRLFLG